MVQILSGSQFFRSGDLLFTPAEVASGKARYARESLRRDRAAELDKNYQKPPGMVFQGSKLFFSPREIESAKRRFVRKKSAQLRG
jgi:hypothetical protein